MTSLLRHPLWLVGFRPFFLLACAAGALYPLAWAAVFSGTVALPASALPALVWHGHELFFGFGWAVLGGFLLTASKNWVGVRGLHGAPLVLAVLLWLQERVVALVANDLPWFVRWPLLDASVLFIGGYVAFTLVKHRRTDSFRDNGYFLLVLPALLLCKHLLLDVETFSLGAALTLGLFRVAFVVMFERTFPPFMKGATGLVLVRHLWLDRSIKLAMLLAASAPLLPPWPGAAVLGLAGALLLGRLALWHPLVALRRFDVGVMYAGALGLVLHLLLAALAASGLHVPLGALATHIFTFLCMGVIIPSMMLRIGQGHTGRKIVFTAGDRGAIGAIGLGALFRLAATQLWPAHYTTWIALAAASWTLCFGWTFARLAPLLLRARVDGKEH